MMPNTPEQSPVRPKVSVVIPVFNTGKYLEQCLESVLNQTLTEIEVLAVDDCSTDDSVKILREYEHQDSRVRILQHAKNQGLPATRNTGVDAATGEYIIHLDSDDFWLSMNMLEQLYIIASLRKCDVLKFGGKVYEDGHLGRNIANHTPVFASSFADEESLWQYNSTFLYFSSRQFLERENIRFNPAISVGEDQIYVAAILTSATCISCIDHVYYAYRVNTGSIMRRRWSALQFSEEVEHSRIVIATLNHHPAAKQSYLKHKISYWRKEIFPRAFEDLNRADRLDFFCNAMSLINAMDTAQMKADHCPDSSDGLLLDLLCAGDEVRLEENFREKVNPHFSQFNGTNMSGWPPASLHKGIAYSQEQVVSGTIYIHAGTHKTGSTAIQDFLHNNKAQLARDDIHYCDCAGMWGPNAHLLPVSLIDSGQRLLGWPSMNPDQIWKNILADYEASGCRNLLLSSEFFTPEYLDSELPDLLALKALLGETAVKFIFYLRPQDSRLESGYSQLVHSGVRALDKPFEEYVALAKKSQDYAWLLGEYEQVFGKDQLVVNRYHRDDFENGNVCRNFLQLLSLNSAAYTFRNSEKNETWLNDVVDFIRHYNALPANTLSIAQKDRFGHYVRAWFSQHRLQSERDASPRLGVELHAQLSEYYRLSNLEVSRHYLPAEKPLEIGSLSTAPAVTPDNSAIADDTVSRMLLDAWARSDKLEQELRWYKNNQKDLRIRQLVSRTITKTVNRARDDVRAGKSKFKQLAYHGKSIGAHWIRWKRRFRNLERHQDFDFVLAAGAKRPGVSAMLRVKDEETRIVACLESIYDLFEEIVVIDNNSLDDTLELVLQFSANRDPESKIRVEHYPFAISRCGTENEETPANSVHSLAYYYNWCLSRCNRTYVCKWDADMMVADNSPASRELSTFFRKCVSSGPMELGQLDVSTVYIDESGAKYLSEKELHTEVRLFPNSPFSYFKKASNWEELYFPAQLVLRRFFAQGIEEIKDCSDSEFSHWTPGAKLTPRKELELENYNLVKSGLADVFPEKFRRHQ